MNNLLTQNSTCFLANALIFLYYEKMQTIWQEIFSLYEFNSPKAIFLYAERALGCITEKDPSNHFNRVPCNMTSKINRYRQSGNVSRCGFNGDGKCRCVAAEAHWADIRFLVYAFKNFRFHLSIEFIGIFLRNTSAKSLFGKVCTLLKIASDSDSENDRRARIAACGSDARKNIFNNVLPAPRRGHHFKTAHVLTAEALGSNGDFNLVTVNNVCMENGRSVIPCVDTSERIADNGTAEIAVDISVMNALVYGFAKAAADKMHILAYFKENDSHSRVLTDWNVKFLCCVKIGLDIAENALCKVVSFAISAFTDCFGKIIRQKLIRLDAKFCDCLAYFIYINFSQIYHPNVSIFRL